MSADWLNEGKALLVKSENANAVPCVVPNEAPNGGTSCMFVPPTDGYFVAWLWINRHRLLAAAELAEADVRYQDADPLSNANAIAKGDVMVARAAYRASKEAEHARPAEG